MATNLIFNLFGKDFSASKTLRKLGLLAGDTSKRIKKFGDDSSRALGKFTKAMAIGSAVASATVAVQGLTSTVGALAGAVAAASGSLLLLPAAGLAGATAFAALKIGASGFGDALKNIGDPEAFAESIKTLAPAAQETAKAVRDLKPAFDDLKLHVQQRLFEGLGEQVSALGETYLPILSDSFGRVGEHANAAMHQVSGLLQESARIADVTTITSAAENTFENLAWAMRPIVGVLLDIAAVGAPILTELTSGAQSAAERFGEFIATARETGRLEGWIRGGLDALSQLGALLGNIGGIIGTVFSSMQSAGGGALGILVQLTGEARAFLNSASGQQVLTTVFTTLHDLAQALLPGVRALGGALVSAITDIAPALPGLGEAFSSIAQSVAPLVEDLGHLAGVVLPPLISAIEFLGPALGPLAGFIGTIVVATKLWAAAQWLLNIAMAANPIGIVIVALGALVVAVALVIKHWDKISAATAAAWQWIKDRVADGVVWVIEKVDWLKRLPGRVSNYFEGLKVAAIRKLGELVSWLGGLGGRVLGALGDLGSLLKNAGMSIMSGLLRGIVAKAKDVYNYVAGIAGKIASLKGPLSYDRRLLVPAGDAIMAGLHAGIVRGIQPVLRTVSGLGDRIAESMSVGGIGGLSEAGKAAQEILAQLNRGGRVFEDFSFRGAPGLVGEHNEDIARAFYDSGGGDPREFLADYIASQRRQPPAQVQISGDGSRLADLLLELIRKSVREQGGNVQVVLGR